MNREYFFYPKLTKTEGLDILIGAVKDARAVTLARIEDMSEHELHWQYKEGWNTVGCLLEHILVLKDAIRIEDIELRSYTEEEKSRILMPITLGEYIPHLIGKRTLAEYKQLLTTNLEESIRFFESMQESDLWMNKGRDGVPPFNNSWLLYHIIEDEIHHRGQISILRKLYKSIH